MLGDAEAHGFRRVLVGDGRLTGGDAGRQAAVGRLVAGGAVGLHGFVRIAGLLVFGFRVGFGWIGLIHHVLVRVGGLAVRIGRGVAEPGLFDGVGVRFAVDVVLRQSRSLHRPVLLGGELLAVLFEHDFLHRLVLAGIVILRLVGCTVDDHAYLVRTYTVLVVGVIPLLGGLEIDGVRLVDVDHREFVAVGQRPLLQGEVVFLGEIGFLDFVHGVRVGFAIAIRGEQFGPGGGPMVAAVERDRITERVPVLLELHRDGRRTVSIRVKVVAPPFGHGYGEPLDELVLHTYRVAVHRGRRLSAVGHMVGLAAFDGESDRVGHPVSVRSLGFGQRVRAVLQLDGARGVAGGPDNRIDVMSFEIGAFDAEFRSWQFGGSADFDLGELHVGLAGTVDHGHVVAVRGCVADDVPVAQDLHRSIPRDLEHDVRCGLVPFRHFALMQRIGAWGEREFLRDDFAVLRQFSFAAGPADRRDGFAADGGACDGELRAGDFAYAIGQAGFGDRHLGGLVFVDHHDRACFVHIGGSATEDDFDNGFRAVGAHLHGEGDGRGRQISVRGLGFGQRVCAVLEIEFRRRALGFPFDRFELLIVGGDAIFRRQFQLCTCDFSAAHVAFGDEHFAGGRRVGVRHRIGERAVLRCVAGDRDGIVSQRRDFLHGIGDLSAVGVFRQIRERCAPLVVCIQRHGLAVHRIAVGDQLHGHVVRADLVRIAVVFPDLVHLDLGGFRRVCVLVNRYWVLSL